MRADPFLVGIVFALSGGLVQGAMLWPLKFTQEWPWENAWLGFSTTAYLLAPWMLAFSTAPHLLRVLSDVQTRTLALTFLLGVGWGLGNLLFGLGIAILGLGLGYTIILGLTVSEGTLAPLLALAPEEVFARRGLVLGTAVIAIIAGTAVCSYAGKLRERKLGIAAPRQGAMVQRPYGLGLFVCVMAGILLPSGNLALTFGGEIKNHASRLGAGTFGSVNALWAVATLPLFLCSAGYCLFLLRRNRTVQKFRRPGTAHYWLLTLVAGTAQMAGIALYGFGAANLGKLGTSIGFPLLMSSMIMTANALGVASGEWRGAGRKSTGLMAAGLIVLLSAIVLIGYGNRPGS